MGSGAGERSPEERRRTPTEELVAGIWATELRLPHIGLDAEFIDLGSHSLQGVAVVARLEERFGVSIPVRVLFEEPTVADLAAWIDRHRSDPDSPRAELIQLQKGSGLRPVFAVPGRRGGLRPLYAVAKLARETDPRRPVFAFHRDPPVPANTPQELWVAAVAGRLTAAVRVRQPQGPYLLLGSCVGGIIAWEMARQLEARGELVHLFLIDTRHPRLRTAPAAGVAAALRRRQPAGAGMNRRVLRRLLQERHADGDADGDARETGDDAGVTAEPPWPRVSAQSPAWTKHGTRRPVAAGSDRRRRERSTAGSAPEPAPERPDNRHPRLEMTKLYRPEPLAGRVRLIITADWRQADPTLGWDALVGDHTQVAVMGTEHGLIRNVQEAAAWLRAQLEEVDPH